ncbi:uncharacterized protein LOC110092977 [Dendrobium catenatum]|uniref:Endonuclease/exonuclease/phosphatase domain-containing protein n=1 Tax=Dendrobium catenatum TaxID=906689 RepID=A0A2I0VB81_9ASPA|nr:uncharacterized protein LOC110092977 [Dendrobium catenatum]PKU60663.1 hypothetical protein MA16_Dca020436 [Dendrobium catenatum]
MTSPSIGAWNIRGFCSSDKVLLCKNLVQSLRLDMLCILENIIQLSSLSDPFFFNSHLVFDFEDSCNNFHCANPGRIWVKWDTGRITFNPLFISSQLVAGMVYYGNNAPFLLAVVYASNSLEDRKVLWEEIRNIRPSQGTPWITMGDFNCCRYPSDKLGGNVLHQNQLFDFNSLIFYTNLFDLASVGYTYTWYNQRSVNPIHIKLDRMLVNGDWLATYPKSHYVIKSPAGSDHSPIVLLPGFVVDFQHRFLFKNFWLKSQRFWYLLLANVSVKPKGQPFAALCAMLKQLKTDIKKESWASSKPLASHIDSLYREQRDCLNSLNQGCDIESISKSLKTINVQLAEASSTWYSWVAQRAKSKWLSRGEDDLKFLYSKIHLRRNYRSAAISLAMSHLDVSYDDVIKNTISHFQRIYNPHRRNSFDILHFPVGKIIPPEFILSLTTPFTDAEIKKAVFAGASNSSPGPDGFNSEFFKSTWIVSGPLLCKAVKSFYHNAYIPKSAKATAITLIPK